MPNSHDKILPPITTYSAKVWLGLKTRTPKPANIHVFSCEIGILLEKDAIIQEFNSKIAKIEFITWKGCIYEGISSPA
jgi:hypothetical protein